MAEPAFKFPHQAILDHAGSTRNFEVLQPLVGRHTADIDSLDRDVAQLERSLSVIRLPGVWTEPALSAKIEALAEYQTIRVRTEAGSTVARIRGGGKIKAGEEITAGATILTLAAGFRPPAKVSGLLLGTTGSAPVTITAAGVLTCSAALKATETFSLDNITFNLT